MLLRRTASRVHVEKVIDAAAANGVALEINSQATGSTFPTATRGWRATAASSW